MAYLQTLASYVGSSKIKQVMIVVGPKDSGKSARIAQMKIILTKGREEDKI